MLVFLPRILPPRRRAMLSPLPVAETFGLPRGPMPGHSLAPYSATADPVHFSRDALAHSHDCLARKNWGADFLGLAPPFCYPSGEPLPAGAGGSQTGEISGAFRRAFCGRDRACWQSRHFRTIHCSCSSWLPPFRFPEK